MRATLASLREGLGLAVLVVFFMLAANFQSVRESIVVLLTTPAVSNLIREAKVPQMYSAIQTGSALGMQTLDQCLQELVQKGVVSREEARYKAQNKDSL